MFLEISQNSQKHACSRVSFLIKLHAGLSDYFSLNWLFNLSNICNIRKYWNILIFKYFKISLELPYNCFDDNIYNTALLNGEYPLTLPSHCTLRSLIMSFINFLLSIGVLNFCTKFSSWYRVGKATVITDFLWKCYILQALVEFGK